MSVSVSVSGVGITDPVCVYMHVHMHMHMHMHMHVHAHVYVCLRRFCMRMHTFKSGHTSPPTQPHTFSAYAYACVFASAFMHVCARARNKERGIPGRQRGASP